MIRALYSAASGMAAQQTNVDTIANNLANANTAGFKMRRAQFQDLMYQNMVQPGAAAGAQSTVPSGLQLGLGTRTASNEIVFTQGDFSQTSNPLDVVIQGKGFFQIQRQSGDLAYTRAGNFQLNKDGNLVTSDGDLVDPQITIPPEAQSITIATDGTVTFTFARTDLGSDRRADPTGELPQSGWLEQPGKESILAHRCFRRRRGRQSRRTGRLGNAVAGLYRAVQRQRGG